MKSKSIIILVVILAILAGASFVALNGITLGDYEIKTAKESIDLGLDLAGGVYVVLEAKTDATGEELRKLMEQSKAIINTRVDGLGVSEPNIFIEGGKRIRIELAGVEDPQQAIDLIGKTAQLKFVDPEQNVVVTGKNVVGSEVQTTENQLGQQEVVVSLEFDKEGTKNFGEATGRLTEKEAREDRLLYIILDEQVISAPAIKSKAEGGRAITDGKAVISGGFDYDSASQLATLIRGGALPVEMEELQTSAIGPTLGLKAYDQSIKAAGIALLLIFAFMILFYRIPGVVASIGLVIYTLILLIAMSGLGVKLTLPGILGLILSIGMAIDANVLIFERIREELLIGKSIRTSIDSGFKRALTSVIDSNVTTLIAGAVLYYFGTGPIKGFGVTLIIGIVVSVLTAVILSRTLLKIFASLSSGKNIKYYGA